MFKKMKIGAKLISMTAIIILITASVITVAAVMQASSALSHSSFQLLNSVHAEKHRELRNYLSTMKKQMEVIAQSRDVAIAIEELVRYHVEMDIQPDEDYDMSSSAENLTKTYDQLYREIDKQLGKYVEVFEYYDVFIICYPHGHVMYTHTKEADLGTNLKYGKYRDSFLAKAWSLAREGSDAIIVDMAPYEPSGGVPAMFSAAPIIVDGETKGVVALQVNNEEINRLVGDAEGMGDSGEIYCVGDDYLMRTDSRFSEESTVLKREVRTKASESGINDQKGSEIIKDYRGVDVYSSYSHVGINEVFKADFEWAIIAEIDKAEVQEPINQLVFMISLISLVVVIAAIIITVFFSRSISEPLKYGVNFASTIAEGNLTQEMDEVYLKRNDEIGDLSRAMDTMSQDLENTIANIIVAAQNLVQAVQEISAGNENLSQRTSEQASSLEEIASTIEESTATINQNAENSRNADQQTQNTSELAQNGGQVIGEAVEAINEVNKSSKRIEEIISVIDEIAFQTNLLALNAAVEAARAGEQGRGFAVVAGEVRNLAQRSGNAAKEISTLIKETTGKVDTGTKLANKSGEIIREIINAIHKVTKTMSEIAAASDEQKQGIQQINTAVTELDSMTQQNAGLVEETASASEEMSNQAQELLVMMEKFKIKDDIKNKSNAKFHKEIHLSNSSHSQKTNSTQKKSNFSAAKPSRNDENIEDILSKEGFEEF